MEPKESSGFCVSLDERALRCCLSVVTLYPSSLLYNRSLSVFFSFRFTVNMRLSGRSVSSKRGFERRRPRAEGNRPGCPHIEFASLEQSSQSGTLFARYPSYPLPSASAILAPMSRFVTTVGRPHPRATEAHVRSDNVRCVSQRPPSVVTAPVTGGLPATHTANAHVRSTINITTANGSSITITGSHIELEVQNLSPPANSTGRRHSVSRPSRGEVIDGAPEDAQTTVDWSADANLARQIETDRVSTLLP
jgi:hypothetical protein